MCCLCFYLLYYTCQNNDDADDEALFETPCSIILAGRTGVVTPDEDQKATK